MNDLYCKLADKVCIFYLTKLADMLYLLPSDYYISRIDRRFFLKLQKQLVVELSCCSLRVAVNCQAVSAAMLQFSGFTFF